jgi:hypothetical protein
MQTCRRRTDCRCAAHVRLARAFFASPLRAASGWVVG